MKVLHLTTSISGGAGLFAKDLKRLLDSQRHENDIFTFKDFFKKRFFKISLSIISLLALTYIKLKLKNTSISRRISPVISLWSEKKIAQLVINYDVVMIHRFANFLSFSEIASIAKSKKKIIIIGIDEALFTPYCSYTYDCSKYTSGCHSCPIASERDFQKITDNYKIIKKIISSTNFSNCEVVFANDEERVKFENSFWKESNIKTRVQIFPYFKLNTEYEHLKKVDKKINQFNNKLIITVSSLHPTKRKGFDLMIRYLKLLSEESINFKDKLVEINIISNNSNNDFNQFSTKNLKVISLGAMDKYNFENMLTKSHLFLSFSRADSGPFTLNMCYYLKTMIFSFRVGVATEIVKNSKSIQIINNFSHEDMLIKTLSLMTITSSSYRDIITYQTSNKWI